MFDCLDVIMQEPILEIQDVVKDLGGLRAVNHCSFEVQQGSITALIGTNGAGKTIKTEITKRHLHCVNSQHVYYVFERFSSSLNSYSFILKDSLILSIKIY